MNILFRLRFFFKINYVIVLTINFINFKYQKYNIRIGTIIKLVRVEQLYNIDIIYWKSNGNSIII
jgi:hypothetical protein